jgi:deoxyribonuclease V
MADIPHKLASHAWNISLQKAAALQTELASHVKLIPLIGNPEIVAGIDVAIHDETIYAAVVLVELSSGKTIEITRSDGGSKLLFPYQAGYRAFREGSAMIKAFDKLHHQPELVIINGHGACHPRQCGSASHIGLRLGLPTIGCARERLVGHYQPPGPNKGDYSVIQYSPQAPGVVLRAREGTNPIFVSPGHRIDLLGAIEQTMRCLTNYRLPEPLRRAHIEAGRFMRAQREAVKK